MMQRRDGHINDVKGTQLVARMFGGLGIFVNPSIHPSIHVTLIHRIAIRTGHIHTSRPIWPLRIFVLVQFGSSCPVGPAACINVPVPSILETHTPLQGNSPSPRQRQSHPLVSAPAIPSSSLGSWQRHPRCLPRALSHTPSAPAPPRPTQSMIIVSLL